MPRSFLLTNRRYIPTPPPAEGGVDSQSSSSNSSNNNNGHCNSSVWGISCVDDRASMTPTDLTHRNSSSRSRGGPLEEVENSSLSRDSSLYRGRPSSEILVAHILLRQAEQSEAVNLVMEKPRGHDLTTPVEDHRYYSSSSLSPRAALRPEEAPAEDALAAAQVLSPPAPSMARSHSPISPTHPHVGVRTHCPADLRSSVETGPYALCQRDPSPYAATGGGHPPAVTANTTSIIGRVGYGEDASPKLDDGRRFYASPAAAGSSRHEGGSGPGPGYDLSPGGRPTIVYTIYRDDARVPASTNDCTHHGESRHDYGSRTLDLSPHHHHHHHHSTTHNNILSNGSNSENVGMDLSIKASPGPPSPHAPGRTAVPTPPTEGEAQDRHSLSDVDSDSGCSTQNEARGHLPPEVEYGWAECHAHFSLLYDLMTQGGRKPPAKVKSVEPFEQQQAAASYAGNKEVPEHSPYDLSTSPPRDSSSIHEPPVLYELMTDSPRKASGRDVPDHAVEVEYYRQQAHHHLSQQAQPQQQPLRFDPHQPQENQPLPPPLSLHSYQSSQQQYARAPSPPQPPAAAAARPPYDCPPYPQHHLRLATLQEAAQDRGMVPPGASLPPARFEPRRSLNDLLYAAGIPPVSPPSPHSRYSSSSFSPPSPTPRSPSLASLSPAASPGLVEGGGGSGGELHTCEDCGKRYSTSSNLARHRQTHRSQGDRKARKCPHCDKVYVSMPAFSMHVRTHNEGCACPHCGKRFSRPWLLQGHIRTHTGEKPFACPQCSKSFADKSNLRAHIQTHSSLKPYVCGRCGKAFALKSYLYKHEESSCMRGERFRPLRRQPSLEC